MSLPRMCWIFANRQPSLLAGFGAIWIGPASQLALLTTDADAEVAHKLIEARGVSWPNWRDGGPGDGPIAKLYHLRGLPTVYVIDAQGKIRSKDAIGGSLDQLVEELVAEREAVAK